MATLIRLLKRSHSQFLTRYPIPRIKFDFCVHPLAWAGDFGCIVLPPQLTIWTLMLLLNLTLTGIVLDTRQRPIRYLHSTSMMLNVIQSSTVATLTGCCLRPMLSVHSMNPLTGNCPIAQ